MLNIKISVGLMGVNCYVIGDAHEAVVVDPGSDAGAIMKNIEEKSIKVKYIVLTHCHFDHIMAVEELAVKTGAEIIACINEKENLLRADINYTNRYSRKPIEIEADVYVKNGDVIRSGDCEFSVIETPGHTSGGMCLYCEKEKILISGDTLFNMSIGRCDLATGDEKTLINSIKNKLFTLPEDVLVFPGHGESTSIGFEKNNNPFIF